MRVDHVEVSLVDRQVDRLADRAARMMQPGACLSKLHEIGEILDRAVTPSTVDIHDEG